MQTQSIAIMAECLDTDLSVGPWAVDAATYHADKLCLSHSQLEDHRKSPPLYQGRHVLGTIPRRKEADCLSLGTALHFAALQPELFASEVVTIPVGIDRRTKIGKADWAAFESANAGKTMLDADDCELCVAMAAAIQMHSKARTALGMATQFEYAIRWQDKSGLWIRNLIDAYVPAGQFSDSSTLLLNLKTAADPSPEGFAKAVANFGYHRSASLYCQGAMLALGAHNPTEVFIVVGKEPPHEVACYVLDDASLALGERQNRENLDEMARRRASGDWSSRHAGLIETVALAPWALKAE